MQIKSIIIDHSHLILVMMRARYRTCWHTLYDEKKKIFFLDLPCWNWAASYMLSNRIYHTCIHTHTYIYTHTYQRLKKKWYLMPPCLTLSIIRYESRVKWGNPGKGVVLSKREPSSHPLLQSPTLLLDKLNKSMEKVLIPTTNIYFSK